MLITCGGLFKTQPLCPETSDSDSNGVPLLLWVSKRYTLSDAELPTHPRSHIPLHKWFYGMYFLAAARKKDSCAVIAKKIGVTQKSAWFLLKRLREACGPD